VHKFAIEASALQNRRLMQPDKPIRQCSKQMQRIVSFLPSCTCAFIPQRIMFSCSCYSVTHLFRLTEICLGPLLHSHSSCRS